MNLSLRLNVFVLRISILQLNTWAMLLGLSFNLYRLKHRQIFLRVSTVPDAFLDSKACSASINPNADANLVGNIS
jgi:hypothetical protein